MISRQDYRHSYIPEMYRILIAFCWVVFMYIVQQQMCINYLQQIYDHNGQSQTTVGKRLFRRQCSFNMLSISCIPDIPSFKCHNHQCVSRILYSCTVQKWQLFFIQSVFHYDKFYFNFILQYANSDWDIFFLIFLETRNEKSENTVVSH